MPRNGCPSLLQAQSFRLTTMRLGLEVYSLVPGRSYLPRPSTLHLPSIKAQVPTIRDHISPIKGTRRVLVLGMGEWVAADYTQTTRF